MVNDDWSVFKRIRCAASHLSYIHSTEKWSWWMLNIRMCSYSTSYWQTEKKKKKETPDMYARRTITDRRKDVCTCPVPHINRLSRTVLYLRIRIKIDWENELRFLQRRSNRNESVKKKTSRQQTADRCNESLISSMKSLDTYLFFLFVTKKNSNTMIICIVIIHFPWLRASLDLSKTFISLLNIHRKQWNILKLASFVSRSFFKEMKRNNRCSSDHK